MRPRLRILLFVLVAASLHSCGLVDSGTPWRYGRYALKWIDRPDEVWLEIRGPDGLSQIRVEPRVFAVGADSRWVVAKQHPNGDRTITNFFVVDASRDSTRMQKTDVVRGPLAQAEFERLAHELHLPG